MEPVGEQVGYSTRRGPADQDTEGRLKGVFGVVVATEDTAAHVPDHWAMPLDKGFECRRVMTAEVVLEQLSIGQSGTLTLSERPAKVLDDRIHLSGRHGSPFEYLRQPYLTSTPATSN
jgi:hypothetical protein